MQEVQKNVWVIIVTYNGERWIEKCLSSLRLSEAPLKVVIVDNSSTDRTLQIVMDSYPECILIETGENLGFGRANNIGISKALAQGAEYIFLLNQDTWIEPNTLTVLTETYQRIADAGILSPIHLDGTGKKLDLNFLKYMQEEGTPNFLSDAVLNKLEGYYDTAFVNAAAWLLSRQCIQKVGGFDPVFPHYGEDIDYVKRVFHNGLRVGVTNCYIYHDRIILNKKGKEDPNELNVKRLHILNLIILKNLSKPFYLNTFSFFRRNFNKCVYYLLDFKIKEAGFLLMAAFFTVTKLPGIYKSYQASKLPNYTFLS